jgi:cytochrome c-type biogenesis protein CcmH
MSGLIVAALIALVAAGGILLMVKTRRQLWPVVAAAVVLGLAGYAWQGQPQLAEAPAKPMPSERQAADALLSMRSSMDASYGVGKQWLILSDSYARDGNYKMAAALINAGLKKYPRDGDMWAGLGVVMLLAGDGKMSPPAEMAFANAKKFNPLNRAPDYFTGLVQLFEGRPMDTVKIWQGLIDNAPDKAVWKPKLESQLNGLKTMLQPAQPAPVNNGKQLNSLR